MGSVGVMLCKNYVFEMFCKVNYLVIDKMGIFIYGNIEISIVEILDLLMKEFCLVIVVEFESYVNYLIVKVFCFYKVENVMVSEVRNIIGSGMEGVFVG